MADGRILSVGEAQVETDDGQQLVAVQTPGNEQQVIMVTYNHAEGTGIETMSCICLEF